MDIYSGYSHKIIVIFHSYVKLPEGKSPESCLIHHLFVDQTDQSLSVASRGHAACRRLCPGRFPATKLWYSKGIMMNHWNILPMNWNCRWLIDDDWNTLTTHHDDDDDDDDDNDDDDDDSSSSGYDYDCDDNNDSVSPSGRTSWVPTAWMPSRNEQGNLNEGPDEGDG